MKIVSVYSSEEIGSAFVQIEIAEKKVFLLETWKAKLEGGGLFDALSRVTFDDCIFNSAVVIEGKPHSSLCNFAKNRGIKNARVAEPLNAGEGLEILREMQANQTFFPDSCRGWKPFAEELNRTQTHKTARAMALFQGLLAADKQINKPAVAGFGMKLGGPPRTMYDRTRPNPYGL